MSRRSVTTVTFSLRMRLPPGVTAKRARDFLRECLLAGHYAVDQQAPLKSLSPHEVIISVAKRETQYL